MPPNDEESREPRVIDLSLGAPGFAPPPAVAMAATRAVENQRLGYMPRAGSTALRELLAAKVQTQNGLSAGKEEVLITGGGSLALMSCLMATCRPGDTILVPNPGFPHYGLIAEMLSLNMVPYGASPAPDFSAIKEYASSARALIWCSPHNPLGWVAHPSWHSQIDKILKRYPRLLVLSDESFEHMVMDGEHQSLGANVGASDRVMTVFGFSKSYSMVDYRIAYVHADIELTRRIARAAWGMSMGVSSISQLAAVGALRSEEVYRAQVIDHLRRGRQQSLEWALSQGYTTLTPSAGCFLWCDISSSQMTGSEFARRAVGEANVLISPGDQFALPRDAAERQWRRFIRLNFGVQFEALRDGLDRLARLFN